MEYLVIRDTVLKKIIKIFLSVFLIFTISCVKAEELSIFQIGSSNAYIGDEITIPVNIKNNKGFSYLGLRFTYDFNSLEYMGADISLFDNFEMKDIVENDSHVIVFYTLTMKEDVHIDNDTTLMNLKFKVKDNAVTSKIELKVTDYANFALQKFDSKVETGSVSIINQALVNDNEEEKEIIQKKVKTNEVVENKINPENHLESSNPYIASIDDNGVVTFHHDGEVEIYEKNSNNEIVNVERYTVTTNNNNLILWGVIISVVILVITFLILNSKKKFV